MNHKDFPVTNIVECVEFCKAYLLKRIGRHMTGKGIGMILKLCGGGGEGRGGGRSEKKV